MRMPSDKIRVCLALDFSFFFGMTRTRLNWFCEPCASGLISNMILPQAYRDFWSSCGLTRQHAERSLRDRHYCRHRHRCRPVTPPPPYNRTSAPPPPYEECISNVRHDDDDDEVLADLKRRLTAARTLVHDIDDLEDENETLSQVLLRLQMTQ